MRSHPDLAEHILDTPPADLAAHLLPTSYSLLPDWPDFCKRFQTHVDTYGHIIYNLDFTKPLPLDDPAPMVGMLQMYLRGEGANPHERQGALEAARIQATETALGRVKGLKRWAFTKALNWAQSLAEIREDGLAGIGLGYPALRRDVARVGRAFRRSAGHRTT